MEESARASHRQTMCHPDHGRVGSRSRQVHMLFTDREVRIEKNFVQGLDAALVRAFKLWATFFSIQTGQGR